jgi:peptide/nickel transport system permease protein
MAVMTSQGPRSSYRQRSFSDRLSGLLSQVVKTRGAGFGLAVVVLVLFLAAAADLVVAYNPNVPQGNVLTAPTGAFWLGTDHLGRDVLSRVIYGSRVAVEAGVVSVGFALTVGVAIGLLAGYWGGWVDDVLMRLVDAIWSFPTLILALAIAFSLGQGLVNAMIAIGVVFTPAFARLVRGQALSVRERDFVTAARVLGAGPARIMLQHIWPNVVGAIIVQSSLMVAQAIIVEAALSFLGLGVEPPQASWGSMLRTGYQYIERAPWISLFPGVALFVTVLSLNLLGDGLRLALDPRLRERGSA